MSKTISLSISVPDSIDQGAILAAISILQAALHSLAPVGTTWPEREEPAAQPATEAPPAYDKCRALWEAAQKVAPAGSLFSIHAFTGEGIRQGMPHLFEGRMPQKVQDSLEAAIVALGHSPWGQEWLSHDENAAQIDRFYLWQFRGYWLTRVHPTNPELGYVRHDTPPMTASNSAPR